MHCITSWHSNAFSKYTTLLKHILLNQDSGYLEGSLEKYDGQNNHPIHSMMLPLCMWGACYTTMSFRLFLWVAGSVLG